MWISCGNVFDRRTPAREGSECFAEASNHKTDWSGCAGNSEKMKKNPSKCLTNKDFMNIIEMMFSDIHVLNDCGAFFSGRISLQQIFGYKGGALYYENDISAKEEIQSESSRIPRKNEYKGWKKSFSCKKIKRKKKIISIKPKAA